MQLIGMLDSPYVRRAAIAMQLLGLHFEHRSLSVFRTFDEFSRINPVVKAPTFVCDDGTVLMDSTLILQYAQSLSPGRALLPPSDPALKRALRLIGLALAATDKSVQAVYEQQLRPDDKQHAPWLERWAPSGARRCWNSRRRWARRRSRPSATRSAWRASRSG